ncbi:SipW-dependent-type signal peptide-containing protein [Thomasclavelia sp.]
MDKKKRTVISLIALLGCILTVSATLAWFTDSDATRNQIKIGKFGIDVIESSTSPNATVSEFGIDYKDPVVIGQEKSKIVDIKNTEELSAFIRLTVEKVWMDENGIIVKDKDPDKIVIQEIDEDKWIYKAADEKGKSYYYLRTPLKSNETVNLFKSFIIENNFDSHEETMSYANLRSKIIITANGVQADDGENAIKSPKLGLN